MVAPATTRRYRKWTANEYNQFLDAYMLLTSDRDELRDLFYAPSDSLVKQLDLGWRVRTVGSLYDAAVDNAGAKAIHQFIDKKLKQYDISIQTARISPSGVTEFTMHDTYFKNVNFDDATVEKASQIDFIRCSANTMEFEDSNEIKLIGCSVGEACKMTRSTVTAINSAIEFDLYDSQGELSLIRGTYTVTKMDKNVSEVLAANCTITFDDKSYYVNFRVGADRCKIRVWGGTKFFQSSFKDCEFSKKAIPEYWTTSNCDFVNCDMRGYPLEQAESCRFTKCKYDGKPPLGYKVVRGYLVSL